MIVDYIGASILIILGIYIMIMNKDTIKIILGLIIMGSGVNLFLILKLLLLDAPGAAVALVIGGGIYILLLFLNPLGLNRVKGGASK